MRRRLVIRRDCYPLRASFRISRGAKTMADVVVAEIAEGGLTGRGEAVPYGRYGETTDSVVGQLEGVRRLIEAGIDRPALQSALPAGAARNAADCALWDLEAKQRQVPAWQLAGLSGPPAPAITAFTLSLDSIEATADAARQAADRPLLKIKLGAAGDLDRARTVRSIAPHARLIADANEGWSFDQLVALAPALAELGVELIEQPLPAGQDESLRGYTCPVPLGADESFHRRDDVARLVGLYQVANIKLDKTGGLTEGLETKRQAQAAGLRVMVGCMVATSLAMAPALLLAQDAAFVDLDGPLLLATDRTPGLTYDGSVVHPAPAALWG